MRAVLQRRVVLGQVEAEVGVGELFEDGLDDLADRLVLEDAAILVLGQEPEPRHDVAFVGIHAVAIRRGGAAGALEA